MIWRITTGAFLAMSEYGIKFFFFFKGFNFSSRDLVERWELVLVRRKVSWLIFPVGLYRTVLDSVQI